MVVPSIAVVGASGNVGRQVVTQCLARGVPAESLKLFASPASAGKQVNIAGADFTLQALTEKAFKPGGVALFCTEAEHSMRWVPVALEAGAYVIDSSSHYRLQADVPLIIPPVNLDRVCLEKKLYAHANCLASPIATVIAPLHRVFGIRYLNIVTYQSTSGAGKAAMDELAAEARSVLHLQLERYQRHIFQRQIAFNVIPQVGTITPEGYTGEEFKIINEIQKVVAADLPISAMAVRVPVLIGHSMALTLSLAQPATVDAVRQVLAESPSVRCASDYDTPAEMVGHDEVSVGRLRLDPALPNGLQLWACSDNLRRGASTDAVEILERLLNLLALGTNK